MAYRNARIVKLNDWHIPFHDEKALKTAIALTKFLNPTIIIIDEPNDFYSISKFDRDPKRQLKLQEEIDVTLSYFNIVRKLFPKKQIILLESNHMERLKKYLWRNAPSLAYLRRMKIEELFELKKFNIKYQEIYVHNKIFVFKHGDVIRQHSGATAKAEYEKEGMSGASGHSHRISKYHVSKRGGEYVWIECGCLCSKNPDIKWFKGIPNYQHGIGRVDFVGSRFSARTYEIFDGKVIMNRRIITDKDLYCT